MMRNTICLLALATAGLLQGCARVHPLPLAPEKIAADFQTRTLADAGLKAFLETNLHSATPAWPLSAWDFTKPDAGGVLLPSRS